MINVVLIGAGKIAESFHLPALKKLKLIKIVGIVDKDISKAKKLAAKYEIKYFSAKLNKILNQTKVEAVDICVSSDAHEKIIMECLNKNLHIICEKPFVTNHKLISKIKRISEKKKLVCVGAQHQRFRISSIILKKLITNKKLGKIYSIKINSLYNKSHTLKNKNYLKNKVSGGPLIDLGSHFIDLALWLLNNPKPKSTTAFESNLLAKKLLKQKKINQNYKVQDYSSGSIFLEKNIIINYEMSYLLNSNIDKFENLTIYGDKSNITWPNMLMTKLGSKKVLNLSKKEIKKASFLMLKNFIDKIKLKKKNFNNLNTTRNTLKIINGLQKSAKEKRTVYFENI